jgi:hypothetical protein
VILVPLMSTSYIETWFGVYKDKIFRLEACDPMKVEMRLEEENS